MRGVALIRAKGHSIALSPHHPKGGLSNTGGSNIVFGDPNFAGGLRVK